MVRTTHKEGKQMAEQQTEGKKWTIPRGPAATAAKNRHRDKNYDRAEMTLPKGMKVRLEEIVKEQGYSSRNDYVVTAIKEKYKRDTGEDLILE